MSESISISPEIKHVITAEEFKSAATGMHFDQKEWFYKTTGKNILESEKEKLINYSFQIDMNQTFIVLTNVYIPVTKVDIGHLNTEAISLLIFNSKIDTLFINNYSSKDWFIIESKIGSVYFQESTVGNFNIESDSSVESINIYYKSTIENIFINNKSKIATDINVGFESICGNFLMHNNCNIHDIRVFDNSQIGNILITDHCSCRDIDIEKNSHSGDIDISNASRSGDIHITKSNCREICIRQDSYAENVFISEKSKCSDLLIGQGSFTNTLIVRDGSETGNIRFENGAYCKLVGITKTSQSRELMIDSGSQLANISIVESIAKAIRFKNNYGNLYLYNATVPLMYLKGCHIHELAWKAASKGELYIEESEINYLNFSRTLLPKESVLSLNNTKVYFARFQELLVQGQLILRHLSPLDKTFDWNTNTYHQPKEGNLRIEVTDKNESQIHSRMVMLKLEQQEDYQNRLKVLDKLLHGNKKPLFRIVDSSLSKTEITGSDLQDFIVEYRDSRLLELFISGTKLPKENIRIFEANEREYKQKASFYSQLKKAYDNQGDIVDATVYHAKSMNYQQKLLLWNVGNGKESFLGKTELFFDYLGFLLNRLSNNHGESWLKASLFVLGASVLFFIASIWSLKYHFASNLIFSLQGWQFLGDWGIIDNNIHKLPGYFLVTHPLDFLSKETGYVAGFWHFFWDIIGRIFIGYGIYQFITAFRRHSRKGG